MKLNNQTVKVLKKDFPIFRHNLGLIYLDNAATSQRPSVVIDAIKDFTERDNANVGRGVYTIAEKAMKRYDDARKVIANFIGAKPNEIVFTKNTTESINLLSYTIEGILPTDRKEIVLTEMEHHSNLIPWQQLAKRQGFQLKFAKIKPDFTLDMEDLKKKITNKTALVTFTHASNVLGTITQAKEIIALAKEKEL